MYFQTWASFVWQKYLTCYYAWQNTFLMISMTVRIGHDMTGVSKQSCAQCTQLTHRHILLLSLPWPCSFEAAAVIWQCGENTSMCSHSLRPCLNPEGCHDCIFLPWGAYWLLMSARADPLPSARHERRKKKHWDCLLSMNIMSLDW